MLSGYVAVAMVSQNDPGVCGRVRGAAADGAAPSLSLSNSAQSLLPWILAVLAGSTDTIGFLGLNGLFTAHITGNLVVLAAHVVAGDPAVLSYILAVPVFVVVLFLTSRLARVLERRGFETLRPLLWVELGLLVAFLVLGIASPLTTLSGMCGVAAMAVQTALVQIALSGMPATAVMTTNVAHFVIALADLGDQPAVRERARTRILQLLPVIVGFMLGCAAGAVLEAAFGLASLALPVLLALLAIGIAVPSAVATSLWKK